MSPTILTVTDTPVGDDSIERAMAEAEGLEYRHVAGDASDLDACLAGASVVLTNFVPLGEQQLSLLAENAVVVRYGIGVDNVDLAACGRLGVRVANVPDYGADVVAEHAVLTAGALVRRLLAFNDAMHAGQTPAASALGPITSLAATTVGLVGAGRIARLAAARFQAFGAQVLAYDPYADPAALDGTGITLVDSDELFERADIVSLHAPLTPDTHHVIDADALARMREHAVLVNTSRGGLVDTEALVAALESGAIAGAALDVTDPEPLPADHPLRSRPDVLLTPHAAFYSQQSIERLSRLAVEEAARAARGEALRSPVAVQQEGAR